MSAFNWEIATQSNIRVCFLWLDCSYIPSAPPPTWSCPLHSVLWFARTTQNLVELLIPWALYLQDVSAHQDIVSCLCLFWPPAQQASTHRYRDMSNACQWEGVVRIWSCLYDVRVRLSITMSWVQYQSNCLYMSLSRISVALYIIVSCWRSRTRKTKFPPFTTEVFLLRACVGELGGFCPVAIIHDVISLQNSHECRMQGVDGGVNEAQAACDAKHDGYAFPKRNEYQYC